MAAAVAAFCLSCRARKVADVSSPTKDHAFAELIAHPPERRAQRKKYVVLYSCCCCCCCCLHTLGAAAGAIVAGFISFEDRSKPPVRGAPSGKWLYWSSLLWTLLIGFVGTPLVLVASNSGYDRYQNQLLMSPIYLAASLILAGPLWMLGALVVMAIQIAIRRDLPTRGPYWKELGKISLGVVLGCLGGILVMYLAYLALTAR
jgi:hypothetical protein